MSSFFKKNAVSKSNCPRCGLGSHCSTPRMKVAGKGGQRILVIGDSPSALDDDKGAFYRDSTGRRLKQELRHLGISLRNDCWYVPAVRCRPALNSKGEAGEVSTAHITNCRPYIQGIIKELRPEKILLLGETALHSYYDDRNKQCTSMFKMAGMQIWDSTYNTWVFPIWSTALIEKKKHDTLLFSEYKRCLKRAIHTEVQPFEKKWNPTYKLRNFKKAIKALTNCLRNDTLIAIDYETTGLDMYKAGHSTASFAWANDEGSWAVPVQHPYWNPKQQEEIYALVQKILKKRKIKKIVQGINFEYPWTKQQMKAEPRGFIWDTQLATHIIDNRTGVTGLKFQCFVRWGIEDYDKISGKYIKSNSKTGFNDMLKMPVDALLEYNALDSLYTYELYKEQQEQLVGTELDAYHFMHNGAIVMCEMSFNGIRIKESFYLKQKKLLEQERDDLIDLINTSDEATQYTRQRGGNFDYNSPKDLQIMLFKVLKLKSRKETKTGYSVDAEVLQKIDITLTRNIIAVRKLNKMIGTYVDGFLKHTHDGMMHPSFSLARARSFRSSSQSPNFQNVPKRDPKAKHITRSGMVPRDGRVLGEMDFSGAEISTSCYYHKDPTFIKYQTEGGGDMHNDACSHILLNEKDTKMPKPLRQCTKGVWTFSQFYGSYYVSCAKQGWEEYPLCVEKDGSPCQVKGMDIGDWMKQKYGSYKGFENHLKKFQSIFWDEWFTVYTEWKDKVCRDYERDGFVETFLGFKFKGYMDSKQCTNYPIQGTSFHLLVYTAVQFLKECRKQGLETLIVGQVHDSLILDIPLEEIDDVKRILSTIVGNLHEVFKWMDFPMGLDLEISKSYEQGGSFASMEPLEL